MSTVFNVLLDLNADAVPETEERNDVISLSWSRGRKFYLGKASPGRATIIFDNANRKYTPTNAASPLYPNFNPGIAVQLRGAAGGNPTRNVFWGFITDIDARPEREDQTCAVQCLDIMERLNRAKQFRNALFSNTLEGKLIQEACLAYGISAGNIRADAGLDSIPYFAFNIDKTLLSYIEEIRAGANGLFYIDGSGVAVYEDRHHRLRDDHITSQYTFSAYDVIAVDLQRRIQQVINHALVEATPRLLKASSTIYTLSDPIRIGNGQTVTFTAPYTSWAVYSSYSLTANLLRDGTGADLTAQVGVSITDRGAAATVSLTNNYSLPVWITALTLTGTAYPISETFTEETTDTPSVTSYGESIFPIDSRIIQSRSRAQAYADYLVGLRKDRPTEDDAVVSIVADNDDTLADQLLRREISDRVTVQVGVADMNGAYHIEELHHSVANRGASFTGEYRLVKAAASVRLFRLDADANSPADSGGLDVGRLLY